MHVVHARADAGKAIVRTADETGRDHGVRALGTEGGAVFAIARDVEYRSQFRL
jgi:hypothetical protein